ncbi:MAG: hypothetical protein ABI574_05355 [Burkholderiales bacterium]
MDDVTDLELVELAVLGLDDGVALDGDHGALGQAHRVVVLFVVVDRLLGHHRRHMFGRMQRLHRLGLERGLGLEGLAVHRFGHDRHGGCGQDLYAVVGEGRRFAGHGFDGKAGDTVPRSCTSTPRVET